MSNLPPVFVDCTPDIANYLTPEIKSVVPDIEIHFDAPANEDDVIARLHNRRHALVYMAYLSERVISSCPDLKTISYLSTGLTTHADFAALERHCIEIQGVKGYGDRAVAEHTILLMLSALRRLTSMDSRIRRGDWELVRGEEIYGKTIGLIGLGGIGKHTAKIATALGAKVIGWSRSGFPADCPGESQTIDALLRDADIISLHLALNSETECFLNHEKLAKTKPGVILVNTARAGLIDEAALLDGLRTGHIGHAALDVFHQEPPGEHNPLLTLNSVTLSAHSAWFTGQAIARLLAAGFDTLQSQIQRHNSQ